MRALRRGCFGIFFCIFWNAFTWAGVALLMYAGGSAIDENHRRNRYVDAQCSLLGYTHHKRTCSACSNEGPNNIATPIEPRRARLSVDDHRNAKPNPDPIRRARRVRRFLDDDDDDDDSSSTCRTFSFTCYTVSFAVAFEAAGAARRAWVRTPAFSPSASSCSRCRRSWEPLYDRFSDAVGRSNVTVPCHYDERDPAATVTFDIVNTSTTAIAVYFIVAGLLAVICGGIGVILAYRSWGLVACTGKSGEYVCYEMPLEQPIGDGRYGSVRAPEITVPNSLAVLPAQRVQEHQEG